MITTVLVDDHIIFSDGLAKLLNDSPPFTVTGKFHSSDTFLTALNDHELPRLLILDIEMPGLSGLDLIKKVRTSHRDMRVVILSMHDESVYIREAQQSGANGYLFKSIDSNTLIRQLTQVMAGENIFPNVPTKPKVVSPLSEQETRIIRLIAAGKSSKDIAQELKLSPLTVQAHRRNILRKLDVNNTAELIKTSISRGFI